MDNKKLLYGAIALGVVLIVWYFFVKKKVTKTQPQTPSNDLPTQSPENQTLPPSNSSSKKQGTGQTPGALIKPIKPAR